MSYPSAPSQLPHSSSVELSWAWYHLKQVRKERNVSRETLIRELHWLAYHRKNALDEYLGRKKRW